MYKLFIAHLTYFAREKVYVADSCDRADSTVIQSVPTLHVCTTALISQAMLATCISHELMKICDFAKRFLCLV